MNEQEKMIEIADPILERAMVEGGVSNYLLEEHGVELRSLMDFTLRVHYRFVLELRSNSVSLEDLDGREDMDTHAKIESRMIEAIQKPVDGDPEGWRAAAGEAWKDNVLRAYDSDGHIMRECTDAEYESFVNESGRAMAQAMIGTFF